MSTVLISAPDRITWNSCNDVQATLQRPQFAKNTQKGF